MKKRILITDSVHDTMISTFISHGYEIDYQPNISLAESKKIIHQYQGVIINSKIKAHKSWIDAATNLEFIGRLGSGMEIIDVPYASSKGIRVYCAPEGNRNAVAEHALGMLLSLANQLRKGHHDVVNQVWDRESCRGYEIQGKTIGIIGFGNNGRQFATKLAGMEMRVLAYDKYLAYYTEGMSHVEESTLEEIMLHSDIISIHLPLTDETHHYIDDAFIQSCKNDIILINTARGNNIETAALIKGLESGKIKGACLDVFENEKPATFTPSESEMYDRLCQFDNVVLSPHVAGWTVESKYKIASVLLEKILG